MGEIYVWMCMDHCIVFSNEDSVRNHEDKMECVAVLIPKADADLYQNDPILFGFDRGLINLLR